MLKKLLIKLSLFMKLLYKLGKVVLGIEKNESGKEDFSSLIEAGFVYLIGLPVISLIIPSLFNPIAWFITVTSALILSNIPKIWDFIEMKGKENV